MQIQRKIFILKGDWISPQDAEDLYEQAQRLLHLRIKECMQRQAIDLLLVKIMTDQNMTLMGDQRHDWMSLLNITIVAT